MPEKRHGPKGSPHVQGCTQVIARLKLSWQLRKRKSARIRQQSEDKQRYWAEQRKRWQCDPLRQVQS